MTTRTRRTTAQIANDLEARARVARTKVKNMERAQQTRRAVIAGMTIDGMAAAGDAEAKRVWDRMLAGLTRKQDRLAFGLEPLAEPESPSDQQAVNPPQVVPPKSTQPVHPEHRLTQALAAWNAADRAGPQEVLDPLRVELGQAIAGIERVSGRLWDKLPATDRGYYGLSDRFGEMLR